MINNYIRGGQIFLHKMRMLKQVWDKSLFLALFISFLITFYASYEQYKSLDYDAGITYLKAIGLDAFQGSLGKKETKMVAVSNKGLYSRNITPREVLKHKGFKRRYLEIRDVLIDSSLLFVSISFGIFVLIMLIWGRAGSITQNKVIIKGGKIFSALEASKFLKKRSKASEFVVGNMNLVKDSETSHILITGTTGSGKTTCMNELMPQIRVKNQPAIIVDYTGHMTKKYAQNASNQKDQGRDIVLGFDSNDGLEAKEEKRYYSWDFWEDVKDEDNMAIIANALFADKGGGYDEMWNNASKQFFKDAVNLIAKKKNPKVSELYKILSTDSLKDVHKKLSKTASASLLDPKNEKTAMSIRTNTIAFIDWMENFKETENKISIKGWFKDEYLKKGSWLFLKSTPKQRTKLRNFYSMLLDLCMNQIMELGEDQDRRIWMIIDELPSLKKLPSLSQSLSEFRKYGGCIMASMQSPHQLFEIYGQHNAYSMLDQFNTKFIFRTDEHNFASYLCKGFGDIEYKEPTENYSYGSHEMRDGVSTQVIEKRKPLLTPKDLATLDNLEAYVKTPEKDISVAKVKLEIKGTK